MAYFSRDLIKFLNDLKKNNNREWFNENKERYIKSAKEPFEIFVGELIDALSPHFENLAISPKEAIFRIYRDVRFSKDKSPYKVQVSAIINPGGRKSMTMPGIYTEITPTHMRVYSGMYKLDGKQLKNLRSYISHNLEEFNSLINDKEFVRAFGEIRGEKNKLLPKDLQEDAAQQPLLYNKQFYYFTEWKPEVVLEDDIIKRVVDAFLIAKPLSEFLYEGIH
jgi:uncharacterized protein (TIGR02453 family)